MHKITCKNICACIETIRPFRHESNVRFQRGGTKVKRKSGNHEHTVPSHSVSPPLSFSINDENIAEINKRGETERKRKSKTAKRI